MTYADPRDLELMVRLWDAGRTSPAARSEALAIADRNRLLASGKASAKNNAETHLST